MAGIPTTSGALPPNPRDLPLWASDMIWKVGSGRYGGRIPRRHRNFRLSQATACVTDETFCHAAGSKRKMSRAWEQRPQRWRQEPESEAAVSLAITRPNRPIALIGQS
jgi:hypothetical protein